MKGVTIRKATFQDLDAILRLNLELFRKERREYDNLLSMSWTYSEQGKKYFRSRLKGKNSIVFVAEYNGKIIGYLCGTLTRMEGYRVEKRKAELENMFIEQKFRGQGIGKQLTNEFFAWCKKNKVKIVTVGASFGNKETTAFYRNLGFKGYVILFEKKL